MREPSRAQAALLALIADHEADGHAVEWQAERNDTYRPSRARLYVERVDREKNCSRFEPADGGRYAHRLATVRACLRHGWLSILHERTITGERRDWQLAQLDLTEDGVIALGLWRERRLRAVPAPLPTMTTHEREIAELAQRALELGYALCAREPVRDEARRMRRAGWFTPHGCWVANSATGLVPTPITLVELRPEHADSPELRGTR